MKKLLTICLLFLGLTVSVSAQDAPTPLSPAQIAAQIKALHPKTLVFVFDITQSTRHNGVFSQERAATATLLRSGCLPGDRVVLLKFGTSTQTVFDQTLTSAADVDTLIGQIPDHVEPGHGTNIRQPHREALQIVSQDLPRPGVIVLLTDSFNDRPLTTDPTYAQYLAYYTLKGLTIYPNTPENRSYEGLLRTLKASGKLTQYGVGVGIASSGRPIERLPVAPGEGDSDDAPSTLAPTVLRPTGEEHPQPNLALIIGIAAAIMLLLGLIGYLLMNRPVPVRLKLGEKGTPRDYRLRPGARISLGGSLGASGPGDDVFPIAGLTTPAAVIQTLRGGAQLTLPSPAPEHAPTVFHNGLRLEHATSLRIGDEIRISVPSIETASARDVRIHVADPKAPEF